MPYYPFIIISPFFVHFHVINRRRNSLDTLINSLLCHHHISIMFLCCNQIHQRLSEHYPSFYQHESWLRPEYKPLHHGYLKNTWNIVMEGNISFFCNIHLLHHYIMIFEGVFWVSLVGLILTDVFQNWPHQFYH